MTHYKVEWTPRALAQLAQLWNESLLRRLISSASNAIDKTLSVDADQKGRQLSGGSQQLVIYPLAVLFRLSRDDHTVTVFHVRLDPSSA
jgi:hypothetical protein